MTVDHSSSSRTEAMFDRFFAHDCPATGNDPELLEAADFWQRLGQFTRPENEQKTGRSWPVRHMLAMAATICAIMIGVGIWWNMPSAPQPWRTFNTSHAQQGIVMLEDGSTVSLAAESRIAVRFSREKRELKLIRGQALFEVAHDRIRPFTVLARDGQVTAVGTIFNIRLDQRDTEVTVVRGIVDVGVAPTDIATGGGQTVARALRGDQITYGTRSKNDEKLAYLSRRAGVDVRSVTMWTRGKLYFDGEPLSEAIAIVNSYASKKLVLRKPALASMPVYGVLDQGDVNGLIVLVNDPEALTLTSGT